MMNMYGAMPFGMLPGQSSSYDPNDARMDMNTYQQGPTISSGPLQWFGRRWFDLRQHQRSLTLYQPTASGDSSAFLRV